MLAGSRRKTNLGIGGGFVAAFAGAGIGSASQGDPDTVSLVVGFLLLVTGVVLFVRGCCASAAGKGYPAVVGLIGLAGLIGLIVLAFLPDRYKCCEIGGAECTHDVEALRKPKDWSSRAA